MWSGCISFFFSSRRRHTRFKCDWSSDVCSSDLGSKEPGGFVMRLGYTQQSLRMLALCQETSDVKLRCVTLVFLSILFVFCARVRVLAGPEAPKQYDPKLFQALRWRLIGPPRGGRGLAGTGVRGPPAIFFFRKCRGGGGI